MSHTPEMAADVRSTAARIKKIFAEHKREKTGKPYRPAARFASAEFWTKAAEICNSVGADPYSFVRATFLYNTVPGGPFPQQIASKAGARWYEDYAKLYKAKHGDNAYANEVRNTFSGVVRAMRSHPRQADFLRDPAADIPDFVRLLLLPSDPVIRKQFGRSGRDEIMSNQHLMDALEHIGFKWEKMEALFKTL